jgi:hypothetical protein
LTRFLSQSSGITPSTPAPSWGVVDLGSGILIPLKSRTRCKGVAAGASFIVTSGPDRGHILPTPNPINISKKCTPHLVRCIPRFTPRNPELPCLLPPRCWMAIG